MSERWSELLDREDVLILDTETTGFDDSAEIVEIAAIDTTGREHLNELVMPVGRIPQKATDVHGIDRKVLRKAGALGWDYHHERIMTILREASLVLAYNADFDRRMLGQSARAAGLRPPEAKWRCLMLDYAAWREIPHPKRRGEFRWHKLDKAHATEVGRSLQEHRALSDCLMALALMRSVAGVNAELDRETSHRTAEGWQVTRRQGREVTLTRKTQMGGPFGWLLDLLSPRHERTTITVRRKEA